MNSLPDNLAKGIAILILCMAVIVICLAFTKIYLPIINETSRDINRYSKLALKLETISQNKDEIMAKYRAYRNNRSLNELFLNDKNIRRPLFSLVRKLNRTQCKLSAEKESKATTDYGDVVTMQVKSRCPVNELYDLMLSITNSRTAIKIERVDISRNDNRHNTMVSFSMYLKAYSFPG